MTRLEHSIDKTIKIIIPLISEQNINLREKIIGLDNMWEERSYKEDNFLSYIRNYFGYFNEDEALGSTWVTNNDSYQKEQTKVEVRVENTLYKYRFSKAGINLFHYNTVFLWFDVKLDSSEIYKIIESVALLKTFSKKYFSPIYELITKIVPSSFKFINKAKSAIVTHVYTSVLLPKPNGVDSSDDLTNLFLLRKGYSHAYKYANSYGDEIMTPFQNSTWGGCAEGCSNIIRLTDEQETDFFAMEIHKQKLDSYFYIYILVLYQHYTLMGYTNEISRLPNNIPCFQSEEWSLQLNNIVDDINVFQMKYLATQISYVSHQNEFYSLLRKKLRINETKNELANAMQSVKEIVEHNKNIRLELDKRKKERKWFWFTIVSGIFVFIQTFNNIIGIYSFLIKDEMLCDTLMWRFSATIITLSFFVALVFWLLTRKKR